jgi:hypothetical protein
MYYNVLVNGKSLGIFGHPAVQNMHLSVSVLRQEPAVFVSAVCLDGEDLYLYEWLQHEIAIDASVEFVPSSPVEVPPPLNRYKMNSESQSRQVPGG